MTREEREKAIDLLNNLRGMIEDNQGNDYDFAIQKAIEAIKQEPCEDVSEKAKKDSEKLQKIEQIIKEHDEDRMPEDYWYIDRIREVIKG